MSTSPKPSDAPPTPAARSHSGRRLLVLGTVAAVVGGAAAYRRATGAASAIANEMTTSDAYAAETAELGWGDIDAPSTITVTTPDGANLAVWDVGEGPTVVLPHCWGCSHKIWVPVARRLVETGHRVVLYDQRGHWESTRGTAPLSIEILAHDLRAVLEARDVHDAVLAGHSMGGMTIMSLATHHPAVLHDRAKALVLVSTAATNVASGPATAAQVAAAFMASPVVTRSLSSPYGRRFVRSSFGDDAKRSHMDLTRKLFGDCDPRVRGGFLKALSTLNLVEGIATIDMPTTVVVGSLDQLAPPRLSDQLVATIPGARLVTLEGRGHMLPLEDPASVTDEIIRAVKG
jgi:non-heme chloroperoxidase